MEQGSMLPVRYPWESGGSLELSNGSQFGSFLESHYEAREAAERATKAAREAHAEQARLAVLADWEQRLRPGLVEVLGEHADDFIAVRFDMGIGQGTLSYPSVTFAREDVEIRVYAAHQPNSSGYALAKTIVRFEQGIHYGETIHNLDDLARAYHHSKDFERQKRAMPSSRFDEFTKSGGSIAAGELPA